MSEKKIYRESEVTGKKDKSTWLIIHDNVYDVTKFLEEVSNKLITSQYLDWSKSRTVTSIMSISQRFQCQFEKFYVIFLWMIWMVDGLKWILGDFFSIFASSSQHPRRNRAAIFFGVAASFYEALYKVFAFLTDYWCRITIKHTKRPKSMLRIMQYNFFNTCPFSRFDNWLNVERMNVEIQCLKLRNEVRKLGKKLQASPNNYYI